MGSITKKEGCLFRHLLLVYRKEVFMASVAQTYANLSKRLCDRFIY